MNALSQISIDEISSIWKSEGWSYLVAIIGLHFQPVIAGQCAIESNTIWFFVRFEYPLLSLHH